MKSRNEYLEQVMQEQVEIGNALTEPASPSTNKAERSRALGRFNLMSQNTAESENAINYRVTGFFRWKNIIVPPNVFAVHMRRGHQDPIHIGLGLSFRFDPYRDTFILIPGAVQTLLISANCICSERQGILVQAYVQWVVDDINIAYRRLDFSLADDPTRIVKIQLKEQAEAAIKDKVTTMSVDEVLSDKQPIIEELTARLRAVAEGVQEGEGLGLKIVTVQIKEAVVSSISLWENLQKPFRIERSEVARKAELESDKALTTLELQNKQMMALEELETDEKIAKQRHEVDRNEYDREQMEQTRRAELTLQKQRKEIVANIETQVIRQQEALALKVKELSFQREQVEHEIETLQSEQALNLAQAESDEAKTRSMIAIEAMKYAEKISQEKQNLEMKKASQHIKNDLTDNHLSAKLVKQLPTLIRDMPKPDTLHSIAMGSDGNDSLGNTVAQLMVLMKKLSSGNEISD